MPIAFVDSVLGSSSNLGASVTTAGIDTSGADLLVLMLSTSIATTETATISDSKGNTWTALTKYHEGTWNTEGRLYYAKNAIVGASHTFTATSDAGATYPAIAVAAFSGTHLTSPFDQQNGATASFSPPHEPGSVTPTEDNELIIAGVAHDRTDAPNAIDEGFTLAEASAVVAANAQGVGIGYLVQTTAAAVNPTWSGWGGNPGSVVFTAATFKQAAAASFVPDPRLHGLNAGMMKLNGGLI